MHIQTIQRPSRQIAQMNNTKRATTFSAIMAASLFACIATPVVAQSVKYGILSPMDGATVSATKDVQIQFDFRNEAKAQHVHLFLDETQIAMGHKAYGEIMAGPLSAGKRKICVSPVNANHTPVGERSCITVIAE